MPTRSCRPGQAAGSRGVVRTILAIPLGPGTTFQLWIDGEISEHVWDRIIAHIQLAKQSWEEEPR